VTFKSGPATVKAKLARPMKTITHVGYCTNHATVDFSAVEVTSDK